MTLTVIGLYPEHPQWRPWPCSEQTFSLTVSWYKSCLLIIPRATSIRKM